VSTPREDRLRAELRREAAAHTPDRAAMLNRIAAARAHRAPRLRALRLAVAALAVAAVLGAGGVARWALSGDHHSPVAAPEPTSSAPPSSAPPSSSSPSSAPPSSAPPSSVPAGAVRGHPGDTKVEKGSLWSDGSVDPASTAAAARSVVTLKASAALTRLDLTIRVAQTPGLTSTGATAAGDFTTTVTHTPGAVLYRFVLRPGVRLTSGTYTFAARYSHAAGGRDAGGDTYEAFAADATHRSPHVYGNFYPAK
jgi:hypothetical protein